MASPQLSVRIPPQLDERSSDHAIGTVRVSYMWFYEGGLCSHKAMPATTPVRLHRFLLESWQFPSDEQSSSLHVRVKYFEVEVLGERS